MVGPELQTYLVSKFCSWQPRAPRVESRRAGDITLEWRQRPFSFLHHQLLYRLEKNNHLPKWKVVYSGGKTEKRIDFLAPRHPHRFRLKVILKAEAVPHLAELALEHFGDENTVYEKMEQLNEELEDNPDHNVAAENDEQPDKDRKGSNDVKSNADRNACDESKDRLSKMDIRKVVEAVKLVNEMKKNAEGAGNRNDGSKPAWLESQYSPETWTNTATDGTSPVCFCMAVKCGYLKQVQVMVDERPELVGLVNSSTGHTPLATAVMKGDINTVRFLLSLGAEVQQPSLAGQTPLQMAVRAADLALVDLLLEKGADLKARDCNGLRAEHYAVDSGDVATVRYILDRGDVTVRDNNGWTPLFRALCQGASTAMVDELVQRGSELDIVDHAGLSLMAVAKLLKNRQSVTGALVPSGQPRESILRRVNSQYPREKALAHFTRVSKKIHLVHAMLHIN